MAKKGIDAGEAFSAKDNPFALSEISTEGVTVETVAPDKVLDEVARVEKFMNEVVTIRVHETAEEGALEVIAPSVNGIHQPIVRGVPMPVKRKYVEALARSYETKYRQVTPNPTQPDDIRMTPKTVLSYPFEVIEDKNPLGRPWLDRILKQAA